LAMRVSRCTRGVKVVNGARVVKKVMMALAGSRELPVLHH
jgi:hypothetical protein